MSTLNDTVIVRDTRLSDITWEDEMDTVTVRDTRLSDITWERMKWIRSKKNCE